ncbi:MAG: protein-disulfide reductase DsbD domain-containing protein, partial [Bacteroidota bacterium]
MLLRHFFALILLSCSLGLAAQFASPISWSFSHEHVEGDVFALVARAEAEAGWALYSQYTPEGGPVPTSFMWTEGNHYELVGKSVEKGHLKSGMDELFGIEVMKFLSDEPVTFTQQVKIKDYSQPIEVMVEYMCCDDEQCLPPTDEVHTYNIAPPSPKRGSVSPPPAEPSEPELTRAPKPDPVPAAAPQKEVPAEAPAVIATYQAAGPAATDNDPVQWRFVAEELATGAYRLAMHGTLKAGWTLYGKDVDPDLGPIPTEFVIDPAPGVQTRGKVVEVAKKLKVGFD